MVAKTSFYSRIQNAKNFIKDMQDSNNRYYLGIGKCDAWSTTSTDFIDNETLPELISGPYRQLSYENQIRSNLLTLKKIPSANVSHMVKKWVWNGDNSGYGNLFVAWDSTDSTIFDKPFYMFDGTTNVYKCLKVGTSQATIKPTHSATTPVTGADGYTWKFMYSLSAEQVPFVTKEYLPVRTVAYANDLAGLDLIQYNNQQAALNDKGKIYNVKITNGGAGYLSTPTISVDGDGTGFAATAVITSGVVTAINITNVGVNYNNIKLTLSAPASGGTQATAVAILSPKNGHGFDPVSELFGNYVMAYVKVNQDEGGKAIVLNDFRQASIIRNPEQFSSTNLLSIETANAIKILDVASVTSTRVDNVVVGVTSGATAFVANVSESAGTIGIKQNDKTGYKNFVDGETINFYSDNSNTIVATTTITSVTVSPAANPDVNVFSGELIITDNRSKIYRTNNSEETYRMMVQF